MPGVMVLVRHAESVYNQANWFTGSHDCDLSDKGVAQAQALALWLPRLIMPTKVFCSQQKRAIHTKDLLMTVYQPNLPQQKNDARLNERDYGDLCGKNKTEVAKIYGEEQLHRWRRSLTACPPGGESLAQSMDRVVACYKECMLPCLIQGESILVVAHGNSIRALLGYLLNYEESELESLNIGWAEPIKIVYDESGLVQSVINYRVKNNPKPSQWPETCSFSQVVDI